MPNKERVYSYPDSLNVPGWIWPLMLADLARLEALKRDTTNLGKQNREINKKVEAQKNINRASAIECQQCLQELPTLKRTHVDVLNSRDTWRTRYSNANTERWLLRGLLVVAAYFGIKTI